MRLLSGFLLFVLLTACAPPPPCRCPDAVPARAVPPAPLPSVARDAVDPTSWMESVVQIQVKVGEKLTEGKLEERFEYGTGFFVNERGRILTSAHVVALADDPRHLMVRQGQRQLQARLLWKDSETDLACLLVDAGKTKALELAKQPARLGQPVFAAGYPYVDVFVDSAPALSAGRLAGLNRSIDYSGERIDGLILTDAFVADGCSGGPLLDEQGRVLGVLRFNLARKGSWLGLSMAQPIGSYLAREAKKP